MGPCPCEFIKMKKEIRYRLNGLELIIQNLHHNAELMNYMSYNLHQEPFNLFNNSSLHWIWVRIMESQILTFYKVMINEEKFSFRKIVNVAKENNCVINYEFLIGETEALLHEYNRLDFIKIRDKYIAHQDLRVPELKADLSEILTFTSKTIELFFHFSKEFKGRTVKLNSRVVDSFKRIFMTIDEYELVKAILIAEQINGNEVIKIRKISSEIEKHHKEIG